MAFSEDIERAVTESTGGASRRLLLKRIGGLALAAPIGLLVLQACGGEEPTPTAVPAVEEETEAAAETEEATEEAEETEAATEEATEAAGDEATPMGDATPAGAASPVVSDASPVANPMASEASPVAASPVAEASPGAEASPVAPVIRDALSDAMVDGSPVASPESDATPTD